MRKGVMRKGVMRKGVKITIYKSLTRLHAHSG